MQSFSSLSLLKSVDLKPTTLVESKSHVIALNKAHQIIQHCVHNTLCYWVGFNRRYNVAFIFQFCLGFALCISLIGIMPTLFS